MKSKKMTSDLVQMKLSLLGLDYPKVAVALRKQPNYTPARNVTVEAGFISNLVKRHAGRLHYNQPPRGKTLLALMHISELIGEPVTPIIAPLLLQTKSKPQQEK
ncbi:MAG: hypothetical protein GY862_33200 [Gammaproteobacteria bacterium]|nr:hypothetical protein [Gammaproteobacteria bacterium]